MVDFTELVRTAKSMSDSNELLEKAENVVWEMRSASDVSVILFNRLQKELEMKGLGEDTSKVLLGPLKWLFGTLDHNMEEISNYLSAARR